MAAIDRTQHLAHGGFVQLAIAKGNSLVGQAQGIAHGATGGAGQQAQGLHFGGYRLRLQHLLQMLQHRLGGHGAQVELQAAREHRHGHLLRVGRGQHKFEVLRRLLQGLEHGVKRRVRQHVHLVDHEDLEAPLHRLVSRLLQQRLHFVHTPVGGSVQLGVIDKAPAINIRARWANSTRAGGDPALAVCACAIERLGQNA